MNLGTYTVDRHSSERTQDGRGYRRIKIGTRSGQVEMTVSVAKLRRYAEKALSNKNGRSQMANGAIVLRVVPSTVVETPIAPAV